LERKVNFEIEYYENFVDKEHLEHLQRYCSGVREFTDVSTFRYVGEMLSTNSSLNDVWSQFHGPELISDPTVQEIIHMYSGKIVGFLEASYNVGVHHEVLHHGLNLYEPGNGVPLHGDSGWGDFKNVTPNGHSPIDFGVIIYITDDYAGGELVFPKRGKTVKPVAGSIVTIPATPDNDHLVNPVKDGKRWIWSSFWSRNENETGRDRPWTDKTMLNLIAERYYTHGKTGAEAVRDVWQDIVDGKIEEICKDFDMPEKLGLIHAINTFSKEIAKVDLLGEPRKGSGEFKL